MIPEFKIASRSRAEDILSDFGERSRFKYLISIGDPEEGPPRNYDLFDGPKLRLEFDDVSKMSDGATLASPVDIENVIRFCHRIDGPVLIHCYAGISRSAAVACILVAMKLGPGREDEALHEVHVVKPSVYPNKHILNLADQLLDRRGKLLQAAFALFGGRIEDMDMVTVSTVPALRVG